MTDASLQACKLTTCNWRWHRHNALPFVSYQEYSQSPQKIAMLCSATFAFSCKRAIFATERNFRATLAHFGLIFAVFFHFGNILGQNRKWNL